MMTGKHFTLLLILTAPSFIVLAQQETRDMSAVTYEEIYDEPYAINKLFIAFQPLYGELFATNVNAGFGMEAHYYLADVLDFKAQFRKTYTRGFYDMNRDLASRVSDVDNDMEIFNYYEFGVTYHIRDFEKNAKTKMLLYKSSFTKNEWASGVPLYSNIPCKVRNIYGIRLGGIFWDSSVDINRALEAQDLSSDVLTNSEGNSIPADQNLFSNINSRGLYLGGSMTWIRNVAVSFDKYEPGVDDLILTVFLDLMYAPSLQVDDIVYTPKDANGVSIIDQRRTYSVSPINTNSFGVRAGIEGKFNRAFSWSYGGEIGLRPSIQGQSVYAVIKIGIPVFGTNLNYKVEAFGK